MITKFVLFKNSQLSRSDLREIKGAAMAITNCGGGNSVTCSVQGGVMLQLRKFRLYLLCFWQSLATSRFRRLQYVRSFTLMIF